MIRAMHPIEEYLSGPNPRFSLSCCWLYLIIWIAHMKVIIITAGAHLNQQPIIWWQRHIANWSISLVTIWDIILRHWESICFKRAVDSLCIRRNIVFPSLLTTNPGTICCIPYHTFLELNWLLKFESVGSRGYRKVFWPTKILHCVFRSESTHLSQKGMLCVELFSNQY